LRSAEVILSMVPPGGNPLLRGLVSQRPAPSRPPADKGKRPWVESSKASTTPKNVEPLTVVVPTSQQRSAPVQGSPRHKKRNEKEHQKDKSCRSPNRLRLPANSGDRAVTMDFLRYDLMVSNRVSVDLNSYESKPYSAKTSPSDLHTAFLELATRTFSSARSWVTS